MDAAVIDLRSHGNPDKSGACVRRFFCALGGQEKAGLRKTAPGSEVWSRQGEETPNRRNDRVQPGTKA